LGMIDVTDGPPFEPHDFVVVVPTPSFDLGSKSAVFVISDHIELRQRKTGPFAPRKRDQSAPTWRANGVGILRQPEIQILAPTCRLHPPICWNRGKYRR